MPSCTYRHQNHRLYRFGALCSMLGLSLWLSGPVSAESTQEPQSSAPPSPTASHRLIPSPKKPRTHSNPDAQATPSPNTSRAGQPNGERKPAVRVPNIASAAAGATTAAARREASATQAEQRTPFALPDVTKPTSLPAAEQPAQATASASASPPTAGHSLLRSAASVTAPSVPLTPADLGNARAAGSQGGVFGAPTSAANPGTTGPTGALVGRGFTTLLNQFPSLAPTLQIDPAKLPTPAPTPAPAPDAVPPVPQVTAPAPLTPPPAGTSYGQTALSWNANGEGDLAGYKIYVGTRSGVYDYPGSPFNVGRTTSTTISNLPRGQTYFFSATAYDNSGNESGRSAEVSKSLY